MRILILATARNCTAAKRLAREAYDRLYYVEGNKVSRIAIKNCDCIIPRIGDHTTYGTFLVEHLNRNLGIFSTASAEGIRGNPTLGQINGLLHVTGLLQVTIQCVDPRVPGIRRHRLPGGGNREPGGRIIEEPRSKL